MKVFILEDISPALAKGVITQLDTVTDSTPIEVVIFSQGGDVLSGNAIIRALRNTGSHITTNVIGLASSMAAIISQVGDVRLIAEDATFNIHNSAMAGEGRGTKENHLSAASTLEAMDNLMLNVMANNNLSANELKTLMEEDVLLSASEAVALGFFDKISKPVKAVAMLNKEVKSIKNMNKLESIMNKVQISAIKLGIMKAELTDEESARKAELKAMESLTEEQQAELDALIAKDEAVVPEALEHEETGAEVLTSDMVSREEFEAFKAEMLAFMEQVLAGINEVPSEEQMIEKVEEQTTAKLDNVLKAIKSKTTIPVASQNFEQPKPQAGFDMSIIDARVKDIKQKYNR